MLVYISRNSRPAIQLEVHQCSRLTHNPSKSHDEAVKMICRYLNFDPNIDMKLDCYVDEMFSGIWKQEDDQDPVCVKSRNGYVMTIGGCTLNCVSKLLTYISL